MTTLLAISPHLDDAAFSCGHLLRNLRAQEVRVVVATPFAASVDNPRGFALACQLDKGLSPGIDYMALRRAEDDNWTDRLDFEGIHGPFREAPHRGYDSPDALFGEIAANDTVPGLNSWIRKLVADYSPSLLLGPLCAGNHVDHRHVRSVLEKEKTPVVLWVDQPYAWRAGDAIDSAYWAPPPFSKTLHVPRECCREAAGAASAYTSQIGFQFGGTEAAQLALLEAWGETVSLYPTSMDAARRLIELSSCVPPISKLHR